MPIYAAGELIIAEIEDITEIGAQFRTINEGLSAQHPTPSAFVYDAYTGDVIPFIDPYRPFSPRHHDFTRFYANTILQTCDSIMWKL